MRRRTSGSARTAEMRAGHRLSPDEVQTMIGPLLSAVYERIFEWKSRNAIWMGETGQSRRCLRCEIKKAGDLGAPPGTPRSPANTRNLEGTCVGATVSA